MQTARKRKQTKPQTKPVVINNLDDEKPHGKLTQLLRVLVTYKPQLFLFLTILLTLVYINWPVPKLTTHAQHWRDSGYLFKYEGNKVFYQDIISLKRPVKLQPILLILHGFPTSSYDWKNLIPNLHLRFRRIVIPDMLGFGFSDKPKEHEYSIKEQATIMEELLLSLKVTDFHILAHDYGDSVAQELLARVNNSGHRFNIKSVCLTNGGILPDNHQPLFIQKLMLVPVLNTLIARLSNSYIFTSRLSSVFGADSKPSADALSEFWSIVRHKEGNLVLPAVLQYLPERQANKDRWVTALQQTAIPLHLIYGPLDPINTPNMFLNTYKNLVNHSTVSILENTGHYPHLENEVGFMNFYNEFLDKVEREFYHL